MAAPVKEGDVLAGKYRVERVLGEGGMGIVVAATHIHLEHRVALKFLLPHAVENAEAVARFLREGRASVKLHSEHVARVTDVGTLDNGAPYMVMEYLEGRDVAQLLTARGALPLDEALDYLIQACEAVAEAHAAGIIHRDLKPANFFLTTRSDGTPLLKVLDFGISKMSGGFDGGMTKAAAVMGSPFYMSPEQMRSSRDVDQRSDVWAMGIILHELVTGSVVFEGATMAELGANVLTAEPTTIRSRRPDAPPELDAILGRCLRKNAAERYASIAEFVRDLAPFVPERGRTNVERVLRMAGTSDADLAPRTRGPLPSAATTAGSTAAGQTDASWGAPTGSSSTSRAPLIAIAAGAIIAAGITAAVVASRGAPTPAAPQPITSSPVVDLAAAPAMTASAAPPAVVSASAPPTIVPAPTAASSAKTAAAAATGRKPATPKGNDPFGTSRH